MAGKRILVVDDDDDIREVSEMSLEAVGGHEVLTARCGEEGLTRARQEQPDAILLDVMMPGLTARPPSSACRQILPPGTSP